MYGEPGSMSRRFQWLHAVRKPAAFSGVSKDFGLAGESLVGIGFGGKKSIEIIGK